MSFNGSGTFVINTAGQPVVSGTVISSTAFNALTADLATGLSTAITKDGQTTPTANIPMGNNKITGLAVGTAATDAANLSQVQSTAAKLINSISGADTVTGVLSPTLGAYAAGQMFYWVAAGDNTGAVTLNIDSLGAKSVTRDGSVALAAGDIKSGEVVVVVYDGTRFQVVSQINSSGNATFANVSITSALNVGGVATFSAGTAAAPSITTSGDTNTGIFFPAADTIAFTEGGVEAFRIDSSANVGIGTSSPASRLDVTGAFGTGTTALTIYNSTGASASNIARIDFRVNNSFGGNERIAAIWGINPNAGGNNGGALVFGTSADGTATTPTERARIMSSGSLLHGTNSDFAFAGNVFINSSTANCIFANTTSAAGTGFLLFQGRSGAANVNSAGTAVFNVTDNGDVTNTNNSYGAISDEKLKQDIVDATSQWDDIKGLRVRKFRYKASPTAPLQIGLVAQEAETVSPGLVEEIFDQEEVEVVDESGNVKKEARIAGTSTKSVKYSVLYMKAIKALQEAMSRIESLEAKVAALEAK